MWGRKEGAYQEVRLGGGQDMKLELGGEPGTEMGEAGDTGVV